ncbi:hypothetical protein TL16_g01126 [Triparma laevis f. inornata]|uniref:Kinesin light chain n=1 Tax=Triparma laevis f. inornata TaxID=1714386 RepID=A0A9W7DRF3_9STRA|nr:hypothetical protein TL16_g01126 [Triparma laevis f. inornata]
MEFFYVLEIVGGRGVHHNVRVNLETQVLVITRSEDLLKLRALAKLCSKEFFDDPSLLVVAWRRILEVLELAMPPVAEKKIRGKKKKQQRKKNDPRKLEVLDTCHALGRTCGFVGDFDDARRYYKRAKEGYEEQLGRDSEMALGVTSGLIMATDDDGRIIEKLRYSLKRCERALGEENVVTLDTLNQLGNKLDESREYEEAIRVHERCLAGRTNVLGEDHKDMLGSLNNLGVVYGKLRNYKKTMEYFERALKGLERMLGKKYPSTLDRVFNIAIVYDNGFEDYGKAEELYERALEGYEQFGKDHKRTKNCAEPFALCLKFNGNSERLTQLISSYPCLNENEE